MNSKSQSKRIARNKIFKISPNLRKIDKKTKIIGPIAFYVKVRKIT